MTRQFSLSFFRDSKDNVPKERLQTWQDFVVRAQTPIVRREKDGESFAPCQFEPKHRKKENVTAISMFGGDLDHGAEIETTKIKLNQLNCKYFIYSTHSHLRKTDGNPLAEPRFRVVIPLETNISPELFLALWKYLKKITGLPFDEAPKSVAQMFFLPAIAEENAPFVFYEHEGDLLDWQPLLDQATPEISGNGQAKQRAASTAKNSMAEQPECAQDSSLPTETLDHFTKINIQFNEDKKTNDDDLPTELKSSDSFMKVWKMKIAKFTSHSPYDQSIANYGVMHKLEDQLIADLIMSHRNKHNAKKEMRLDLLQRVIFNARAENSAMTTEVENNTLADNQRHFYQLVGFHIDYIEKRLKKEPEFTIYCKDGRQIKLANGKGLSKRDDFIHAAQIYGNIVVPQMLPPIWLQVRKIMTALTRIVSLPEDVSAIGDLKYWLIEYLQDFLVIKQDKQIHLDNLSKQSPGILDGQIYIHALSFGEYVRKNRKFDTTINRSEIIDRLTEIKAVHVKKSIRSQRGKEKKVFNLSLYALPSEFLAAMEANEKRRVEGDDLQLSETSPQVESYSQFEMDDFLRAGKWN